MNLYKRTRSWDKRDVLIFGKKRAGFTTNKRAQAKAKKQRRKEMRKK